MQMSQCELRFEAELWQAAVETIGWRQFAREVAERRWQTSARSAITLVSKIIQFGWTQQRHANFNR
ncbi:hypothetical protein AOG23_33065 [Rhizobium acidisoli]|nr:hypothetical protein AOG23_33065 [Rhizobium acidisoli]